MPNRHFAASRHRSRSNRHRAWAAASACCEQLERRQLLCALHLTDADRALMGLPKQDGELPQYVDSTPGRADLQGLVWSNKGTASNDSDGFNACFGMRAAQARAAVDGAVTLWRRVINNFRQDGGNNQLDVSISMEPAGTSLGGSGGVSSLIGSKPRTGSILMGRGRSSTGGANGDGDNWFLDPTPLDNSEYAGGQILNAFASNPTPGGALNGKGDFQTLAVVELAHVLGMDNRWSNLAWKTTPLLTNLHQPDTRDAPGTLWAFTSGTTRILVTTNNGGGGGTDTGYPTHVAYTPNSASYQGNGYFGIEDCGTAGGDASIRYLPSNLMARMLATVYGYDWSGPENFGTFYSMQKSDGSVLMRGGEPVGLNFPSNDNLKTYQFGSNIFCESDLGNVKAGQYPIGTLVSFFFAPSVSSITIDGRDGNDQLEVHRFDDYPNIPVSVIGGSGNDTLSSTGLSGTVNVTRTGVKGGFTNIDNYTGLELLRITCTTGVDTINVRSTYSTSQGSTPLFIDGVNGADIVNIGYTANGVGDIAADVQVNNTGAFTTINVNDSGNNLGQNVVIDDWNNGYSAMAGLALAYITWKNADTTSVNITTGGGADSVSLLRVTRPILLSNAGGVDSVSLGNSVNGLQSIIAAVTLHAFYGLGQPLTLDDSTNTVGRSTSVTRNSVNGDYLVSGLAPGLITFRDYASVVVRESGGSDTFAIAGGTMGNYLPLTVNGNGGNDVFNLTAFDNWGDGLGGTFVFPVTFDGGSGFNSLSMNDASRTTTSYQFYPTRFYSREPSGFGQGSDFTYLHMNAIGLTCSNSANAVSVYGVSSDIDPGAQVSILLSGGNDVVAVYPRNAQGNLTINGNLGIGGGAGSDALTIEDTASSQAINYRFLNTFGAGTTNIAGLGAAGFGSGSDLENITINAGSGNDTFNVDSFKSGDAVTLNGGLGDDVCNFGNNDVAGNVTSIASFLFNGMEGTDTFNLRNATPANTFTYAIPGNTTLQVSRSSPSYFVSLEYYNTEHKAVYAGPSADTMNITSFASGALEFHGAGGDDVLNLPTSSDLIGRQVSFFGDAGTLNRIVQAGNTKAVATTLHVTDHTIGAFAGDDFFAAGGSMYFDAVQSIALRMGTGADTAFVAPNAIATISIVGGNPTSAPGDTIDLALANAQNYVITGTPANGSVTSSNLKTLGYSGFESGPNVDDSAPAAANLDFNFGGAGRGSPAQSISATFSEDVGGLISSDFLSLTNTTTGQVISPADITLAYDPNTFVATFTFTGFPGGVLPDGAYQAQVAAGYTDFFGNAGDASTPYGFVWSAGTADADNFRVALDGGTLEYLVYLNDNTTPAFVGNPNTSKIVLFGGDGDDAFIVETPGITPGDVILDGGAGANSFALVGTPGPDTVAFNATDATINGGRVALTNIGARSYDGAGAYDTLALNAGSTTLLGASQHFADLSIADDATALVQPGTNGTIVTRQLTMAPNALFDLADNDLLVDVNSGVSKRLRTRGRGGDPLTVIQTLINAARNGGTWDGFGITSSAARDANPRNTTLGVLPGSDYTSVYGAGATFNGEAITDGAVLVKYTYYGDTDFNGVVNFDDYSRTDAGFNGNKSGWLNGDFDGNGVVNFDDYSLIDLAFNTQGTPLRPDVLPNGG